MKQNRFFITFLIALLSVLMVNAKGFEPNTRWPYVFENFTQGKVYFKNNTKMDAQLNIHLWGNKLHYVGKDGCIMECTDKDIVRIEIGNSAFIYVSGEVMKIEKEDSTKLLLSLVKADFKPFLEGTGAYGASLNSAAVTDLNSLDLGGLDNPELGRLEMNKHNGKSIYTSVEYYFLLGGRAIKATKSAVTDYVGSERKEQLKSFLKENKINWKSPERLALLLHFL